MKRIDPLNAVKDNNYISFTHCAMAHDDVLANITLRHIYHSGSLARSPWCDRDRTQQTNRWQTDAQP